MPIQHIKGGSTLIYGDESMNYFRLVSLKMAVGLELKGMRISRGPVVWKRVAKEFNIPHPTKQKVYDWITVKVDKERPKQVHTGEGVDK